MTTSHIDKSQRKLFLLSFMRWNCWPLIGECSAAKALWSRHFVSSLLTPNVYPDVKCQMSFDQSVSAPRVPPSAPRVLSWGAFCHWLSLKGSLQSITGENSNGIGTSLKHLDHTASVSLRQNFCSQNCCLGKANTYSEQIQLSALVQISFYTNQ